MRANDQSWCGLHPDILAAAYGEQPAAVDMAFAENRSEALVAPGPLAAVQQAHWAIRSAFLACQAAREERRQLAAEVGETIRASSTRWFRPAGPRSKHATPTPRARDSRQATEQGE